jgi:hypothetical protein
MDEVQRKKLLETMGEQIDRAITVCMRPPGYNWGATPKLWEAGYKKFGRPLALLAAEKLLAAVKPDDTVILSTGWPIPPLFPEGEICGLAGVSSLARALSLACGAKSLIVTEELNIKPIKAVAHAGTLRVWDYELWKKVPSHLSLTIRGFPIDDEEAKREAKLLLDETQAKAVITVEKNDVNHLGVHHTGEGGDMSPFTAKVEHLVAEANRRGILTIGIGDVGNEIGFANIRETVQEVIVPFGKECQCPCGGGIAGATPTECTVVATASNKGAYGVAACLAGLTRDLNVLHSNELAERMMRAAADYPVYDSMTVTNTYTEDGAPFQHTLALLDQLRWLVEIVEWKNPLHQLRVNTGSVVKEWVTD